MTILTCGATRIVFLTRRRAIKVPRYTCWRSFLLGLLANMQEVSFSRMSRPELCPVDFHLPLGLLVVMPRVRPMTDEEFLARNMAEWVDRGDFVVPAELKTDSFGWLNGRLVAVDYGGCG